MREGWSDVPISDLVTRSDERLGANPEPTILTCTEGAGLIRQADKFRKRIAADDTSDYKVVRTGDLVYNPYLLWKGAIAQSHYKEPGITSPVYEVLRPLAGRDPGYLGLALCHDTAVRQYDGISIGSIERRRRAVLPEVLRVRVPLPPLPEQRRIVDLVSALDETCGGAEAEATSAQGATAAFLHDVFSRGAEESGRLGNLATLASGPSWKAADESEVLAEGSTAVVGIPNTPAGSRHIRVDGSSYVRGLPARVRLLALDSLLMIRTNGNRARIGNVYQVPNEAVGNAYSAFQIGIFPRDGRDTAYLYWYLSSPTVQQAISEAASGSTGLGNIAVSWLNELRVAWPTADRRAAITQTADALANVESAAQAVRDRLAVVRQGILAQLLSGVHAMPASYDRFLNGVA